MLKFAVFYFEPAPYSKNGSERVEAILAYKPVTKNVTTYIDGKWAEDGYMPALFPDVEQAKHFIDATKRVGETEKFFFIQEVFY